MHKIVYLDTETSGLPQRHGTLEQQPYIHSCSVIKEHFDERTGEHLEVEKYEVYDRDTVDLVNEATVKINGITKEYLLEHGIPSDEMYAKIKRSLADAEVIVCHNTKFDLQLLWYTALRRRDNELIMKILTTKTFCTSAYSRHYSISDKKPYQMNLRHLHDKLFGYVFDGAHNALADTIALRDCTHELLKRGEISAKHLTSPTYFSYVTFAEVGDDEWKLQISNICPKTFYPMTTQESSSFKLSELTKAFNDFTMASSVMFFRTKEDIQKIQTACIENSGFCTTLGFKLMTYLNREDILDSRELAEYHKSIDKKFINPFVLFSDNNNKYD
ncbi:DEDDh 3'-5' exonuclease [Chryseobacterium phage MA9V-2]|nr:DEDDh 3'-5' exonuclease [Chryseobacterium phage MA9V-2]